MEQLLAFLHKLRHGGQLKPAPARSIHFHIVLIPSAVRLVLPLLRFELLDNGADETEPLHPGMTPELHLFERFTTVHVSKRCDALKGLRGSGAYPQPSLV